MQQADTQLLHTGAVVSAFLLCIKKSIIVTSWTAEAGFHSTAASKKLQFLTEAHRFCPRHVQPFSVTDNETDHMAFILVWTDDDIAHITD